MKDQSLIFAGMTFKHVPSRASNVVSWRHLLPNKGKRKEKKNAAVNKVI